MSEIAKKFATIDEWVNLPDDDRSELIEGELLKDEGKAEVGPFCGIELEIKTLFGEE